MTKAEIWDVGLIIGSRFRSFLDIHYWYTIALVG